MNPHPDRDNRPGLQRRYLFPAGIFVSVAPRKTEATLDGALKMLRSPAFWAIMLALTVLMFIGALMLSDHLRDPAGQPAPSPGRVYYALPR